MFVHRTDSDTTAIRPGGRCARANRSGIPFPLKGEHRVSRFLRVSAVFEDQRNRRAPYAITIRIGAITRTERYSDRRAANLAREEAKATLSLLAPYIEAAKA